MHPSVVCIVSVNFLFTHLKTPSRDLLFHLYNLSLESQRVEEPYQLTANKHILRSISLAVIFRIGMIHDRDGTGDNRSDLLIEPIQIERLQIRILFDPVLITGIILEQTFQLSLIIRMCGAYLQFTTDKEPEVIIVSAFEITLHDHDQLDDIRHF